MMQGLGGGVEVLFFCFFFGGGGGEYRTPRRELKKKIIFLSRRGSMSQEKRLPGVKECAETLVWEYETKIGIVEWRKQSQGQTGAVNRGHISKSLIAVLSWNMILRHQRDCEEFYVEEICYKITISLSVRRGQLADFQVWMCVCVCVCVCVCAHLGLAK